MSIISLHLLQRIFTIRFLVGLITGILFTIIFYHPQGKLIEKHFRSDQSKFEYEKNDGQLLDENEKIVPSPLWNQSWDSVQRRTNLARHLYLIRHGQYFDDVRLSEEMKLTALGQEQVKYTGQRLNQMNITFDRLIHSTMVRARESAQIINDQFDRKLPLIVDANLIEGIPIAPSPYSGISQNYVDALGDRKRIDETFARYFHRAKGTQIRDTHDILVFHANILRYFICKIMQFPLEAWLRMTLNHGSITQLTILGDGNVILKTIGDSGFIPSDKVTF